MRLFSKRIENSKSNWAFLRWYDIVLDGELYLTRFNILKTPWFSIKLHWIIRPDSDRALHTHPWHFASLVLWGGYREIESKTPWNDPGECRRIGLFNYKNTETAHRITHVQPHTLTLVVTGPRLKSWGFYDIDTFEYFDWKDYHKTT